jgi:Exoribonuclease R
MNSPLPQHVDLQAATQRVMLENGFGLAVPPGVAQQLSDLERQPPLVAPGADVRDLRSLPWSSIDNDTSRDLDQLEVAERLPDGTTKVIVAIADVDAFVQKDSPIDRQAAGQTTTVYTIHSTAPNRRFADLVTQRVVKAVLANQPPPYTDDELRAVAANCTSKADAARKVERDMAKRIAAVAMSGRIGETFDAIVTGVTPHGTFVRVVHPHVEGLLAQGQQGADVGDKLRVKLIRTDIEHGFVDFAPA